MWTSEQSQTIGLCSACESCPANGGTCEGLYGNLVTAERESGPVVITSECFEYAPICPK